ncbi:MAG: hypothetical protein QM478_11585 [Flavobacteriaceae bacterium]
MDDKGLFLLCEQIANLLGFKVDRREDKRYFTRIIINEKTAINFNLDWRKNNKVFAQCATNKLNYNFLGPKIGFSYKRDSVGIANDIKRRLLKDLDQYLIKYLESEKSKKMKHEFIRNKNNAFLTAHSFLKRSHDFSFRYSQTKYNLKIPIETSKLYYQTMLEVTPELKEDYMDIKMNRIPDQLGYEILECFRKYYDPIKDGDRIIH